MIWMCPSGMLSGGQKAGGHCRCAGYGAGCAVLDEPTAGLDPGEGMRSTAHHRLHRQRNITVIIVSHSMEDMANFVDRLIVMNEGKVALDGTPGQVFSHYKNWSRSGLWHPR